MINHKSHSILSLNYAEGSLSSALQSVLYTRLFLHHSTHCAPSRRRVPPRIARRNARRRRRNRSRWADEALEARTTATNLKEEEAEVEKKK